jgi:hypothetical protein
VFAVAVIVTVYEDPPCTRPTVNDPTIVSPNPVKLQLGDTMRAGTLLVIVHASPAECPVQPDPDTKTTDASAPWVGVRASVPATACTIVGAGIDEMATTTAENSRITATRDLNLRNNMEHASLCGIKPCFRIFNGV